MSQVITFEQFTPVARYDSIPWTNVRIEESDTETLSELTVWTELETQALSPVDADPSDPAARNFTTELADDAMDLWYRIIFVDGDGDESTPTDPIQNTDPFDSAAYATVDELARILKIRQPSDEQEVAMRRVLVAAAGEINAELDFGETDTLTGWELSLVATVNLDRAVEHWRQQESPFGLVGLGPEMGSAFTASDSWKRHAIKLSYLKRGWGFS